MSKEFKIHNKKIKVGHLYDLSFEWMENLVPERTRKTRKEPRSFSVPSRISDSAEPINFWQSYTPPTSSYQLPTGTIVLPTLKPVIEERPMVHSSYYLTDPLTTFPGHALVVDEYKTGTRLIYYKVWLNGEERFFSETQLLYAQEIK